LEQPEEFVAQDHLMVKGTVEKPRGEWTKVIGLVLDTLNELKHKVLEIEIRQLVETLDGVFPRLSV